MSSVSQPSAGGVPKLCAEARACAANSDYAQALQLLQRAKGLDPANDKVLLELGRVSSMNYDFAAAECYFAEAVKLTQGRPEVVLTAGHYWMDVRNFEAATKYFEMALRASPVPIVTYVRLGEMYSRLRRMDDALAITERALREWPDHEGALLARGRVLRQLKQSEEAEKLLRRVIDNTNHTTEARAAAEYELGALFDKQERFDEAVKAFHGAKDLLRPTAGPMLKTFLQKQARLNEFSKTLDKKTVERWREFGRRELQPARRMALLCGHARSGTTLLEYVLDAHPAVISADEIAVFQSKIYFAMQSTLSPKVTYVNALDAMSPRTIRQFRNDYRKGLESFLGQGIGDRLLLDKNPAMTFDISAVTRTLPEAKLIVAIRDPRDVCVSCFTQAWPVLPDTIPYLSMEATIDNYIATMSMWLGIKEAIGDGAIEVRYEDLIADVGATARRTLDFLGLPWNDGVLQFNTNAEKKVVRSPTYVEVAKPIYKSAFGRWRNYEKYFGPAFQKLGPLLKALGYS